MKGYILKRTKRVNGKETNDVVFSSPSLEKVKEVFRETIREEIDKAHEKSLTIGDNGTIHPCDLECVHSETEWSIFPKYDDFYEVSLEIEMADLSEKNAK